MAEQPNRSYLHHTNFVVWMVELQQERKDDVGRLAVAMANAGMSPFARTFEDLAEHLKASRAQPLYLDALKKAWDEWQVEFNHYQQRDK